MSLILLDSITGLANKVTVSEGQRIISEIIGYGVPVEQVFIEDDDPAYGFWQYEIIDGQEAIKPTTATPKIWLIDDTSNYGVTWQLRIQQGQIYLVELLYNGPGRLLKLPTGKVTEPIFLKTEIPRTFQLGNDRMTKHYVNEIGAIIILDAGADLSSATSLSIKVKKPDGTTVTWPANVYNLNGQTNFVKYTTVEDDLDQAGRYELQPYIVFPTWQGYGETAHFLVYPTFS